MKIAKLLSRLCAKIFSPVKANALFFVMMYVLGCVCAWVTLPPFKGAEVYQNLYTELFIDLYFLCLLLMLVPSKGRKWVRLCLYLILYSVALVDAYCFVSFGSTLNPSMLMLVGETNGREAWDFISALDVSDFVFSNVGWLLLLAAINVLLAFIPRFKPMLRLNIKPEYDALGGLLTLCMVVWGAIASAQNKEKTWQLMRGKTIGEVEHTLTEKDHAVLYTPMSRLVFSIYANKLAAKQIEQLVKAAAKVQVDSCSFRSPNIVLIIGESYGKHHSQQYGYFMPTTPRQIWRAKKGHLVPFTDVVSPWNLTSFVFKNVFSLYVKELPGAWCDYPLFPEIFRKAGYKVTFLTNQFLPEANAAVYDFSGGFFLNNPALNKEQFDLRNEKLHLFDEDLLADYDDFVKQGRIDCKGPNLIIFHLIGQHVNYRTRCPKRQFKFFADDYMEKRPELSEKQRTVLSYYDNAVRYNDSIVDRICKRFERKDAIVIYMPDHGEECYEDSRGFICRNHSAVIDWPLAHYEFEIPFWIYCSPRYVHRRPELFREIVLARNRRLMTDALPHMLLYLAGITKGYHPEYNVLSDKYDEMRPRLLKGYADYDKLREAHFKDKRTQR